MRRTLIFCLALVLVVSATGAAAGTTDLPYLGSSANSTLTLSDEAQIGRMVMRDLRDQNQLLDDPEIIDYLQNLGNQLAAQAPESAQGFNFFVVRDNSINAFALPGGFIGVNQGLITATANEAQLASVLAHEIAHVTQRHIARSMQAQVRQSLASAAALLAAIIVGAATGSADATQAGIAIATGAAAQQGINFTRANEYEADRIGISFLAAAGFDANSMSDFFEMLGRRNGLSGSQVPEFLKTHPVTANRIADSRSRAAQLKQNVRNEAPTYAFIRERVRVIGAAIDSDLQHYYTTLAKTRVLSSAQRYGAALAKLNTVNRDEATQELRRLSAAQPTSPMLQAALGQALLATGKVLEARQTLQAALELAPRNVPLTLRYAEVLLQSDGAIEAHAVLLDLFNNVPPTPEQIRYTALAASNAGDMGDSYYYLGEYHLTNGDLKQAFKVLELALAEPNLSVVQQARFEARIKEVRDALVENRRGWHPEPAQK